MYDPIDIFMFILVRVNIIDNLKNANYSIGIKTYGIDFSKCIQHEVKICSTPNKKTKYSRD